MAACTPDLLHDEVESPNPALAEDGDAHAPFGDCGGEVLYYPEATLISVEDYPDYELAFHIDGNFPGLPAGCVCASSIICLALDFTFDQVESMGIASSTDQSHTVTQVYKRNAQGTSAYLLGKERDYFPNAVSGLTNPEPFNTCYEPSAGNILVFNIAGDLPAGTTEAVITSLGGLCIVDNIDNPNG